MYSPMMISRPNKLSAFKLDLMEQQNNYQYASLKNQFVGLMDRKRTYQRAGLYDIGSSSVTSDTLNRNGIKRSKCDESLNPSNVALQRLIRGLSKDKTILDSVLFDLSDELIKAVVNILPKEFSKLLVKSVMNDYVKKRGILTNTVLAVWLKEALDKHGQYLLTVEECKEELHEVYKLFKNVKPWIQAIGFRLDVLVWLESIRNVLKRISKG